jgi:hypothetical protein
MSSKIGRIPCLQHSDKGFVRILIGIFRPAGSVRFLIAAMLAVQVTFGSGCEMPRLGLSLEPDRSSRSVRADWDDVEAAVMASTAAGEVAVVTATRQETRWTFDLKTILGERGVMVVTLEAGSADARDGSALIGVQAHLGRRGDPDRESRLVRAVVERLQELAGRETAPLPTTPE